MASRPRKKGKLRVTESDYVNRLGAYLHQKVIRRSLINRRWFNLLAIILGLGLLVLVVGLTSSAKAQSPINAVPKVNVGVYLLNVGKLDTTTGAYTLDFFLSLRCDGPCPQGMSYEFMNGRSSSTDKIEDEPNLKTYRIQATLNENLNLRAYPFDSHQLTVVIEDRNLPADKLVYEPDVETSGIDENVIVSGWQLDPKWGAKVVEHIYPESFGGAYSRYVFYITIQRAALSSVLKALLPAFFIMLVGFLGLILGPDKVLQRLTINTGALTAAVLFHLNLTSSIPPVGYLTYADKFMVINYVANVLALGSTVWLMFLTERKKDATAKRVYNSALILTPALWLILQILNGVFR